MDASVFCELLNGDTVDIYVGPAGHHYRLSLKLLSHHSSYFDRAFNGDFKEGATKRLDLPDEDIDAFNLLVQWIYTGQVNTPKCTDTAKSGRAISEDDWSEGDGNATAPVPIPSSYAPLILGQSSSPNVPAATTQIDEDDGAQEDTYPEDIRSHLKLYVLADKLDMRVLKNQTIDAIIRAGYVAQRPINTGWSRSWYTSSYFRFHPETIIWIYQNTLPGSPLRRLASTSAAYTILLKRVNVNYYEDCLHKEFLIDLVNAMQDHAESAILSRTTSLGSECLYHDHSGDEVCQPDAAGSLSVDQLHRFSPAARFVWLELKMNTEHPVGVTVQQLASLTRYSVEELRKAAKELIHEGLVLMTVNEDTWLASDREAARPSL